MQRSSSTGLIQQEIPPDSRCIVLRPGTAGEVLKWKVTFLSDALQSSAGMSFTVKLDGLQKSTGQLRKRSKSVGGEKRTASHSELRAAHTSGTVGVGVTVAVAVGVGVIGGVGEGVAHGSGAHPAP